MSLVRESWIEGRETQTRGSHRLRVSRHASCARINVAGRVLISFMGSVAYGIMRAIELQGYLGEGRDLSRERPSFCRGVRFEMTIKVTTRPAAAHRVAQVDGRPAAISE